MSVGITSKARSRGRWPAAAALLAALALLAAGPAAARAAFPPGAGEAPHVFPPRPPAAAALASSTSQTIADPTDAGARANGAIFITLGHGEGTARCSGTSVSSPNLSLVITAGHCVHEDGSWFAKKWVFIPGYHHGERPFGTFTAKWLGSTPQWIASENENYDIGAAVVGRNERGQRLAAAVGAYGFAWGLSPKQIFDVYGYPVARPFNGGTLQVCTGAPFEGHDLASFLTSGPLDLAVPCPVSAGGSGGGWLIRGDTLNSITTDGYSDDPGTDYGPYFGKAAGDLYRRARRVK